MARSIYLLIIFIPVIWTPTLQRRLLARRANFKKIYRRNMHKCVCLHVCVYTHTHMHTYKHTQNRRIAKLKSKHLEGMQNVLNLYDADTTAKRVAK